MRLAAGPESHISRTRPNLGPFLPNSGVSGEFRLNGESLPWWGTGTDSAIRIWDLEIPCISYPMRLAADQGRRIFHTPAPFRARLSRILARRGNSV